MGVMKNPCVLQIAQKHLVRLGAQVLRSIACAAIAVQEESVHPLNPESRLNNLIP